MLPASKVLPRVHSKGVSQRQFLCMHNAVCVCVVSPPSLKTQTRHDNLRLLNKERASSPWIITPKCASGTKCIVSKTRINIIHCTLAFGREIENKGINSGTRAPAQVNPLNLDLIAARTIWNLILCWPWRGEGNKKKPVNKNARRLIFQPL